MENGELFIIIIKIDNLNQMWYFHGAVKIQVSSFNGVAIFVAYLYTSRQPETPLCSRLL